MNELKICIDIPVKDSSSANKKIGDFGIIEPFRIGDFGIFTLIKFGDFGISA